MFSIAVTGTTTGMPRGAQEDLPKTLSGTLSHAPRYLGTQQAQALQMGLTPALGSYGIYRERLTLEGLAPGMDGGYSL